MASFSKGSGYSKSDLIDSGTPLILYGRLYTKYETVITEVDTYAEEKKGSVFSKGGEVIVPASGETAEDISVASVVEKSEVLLGGDLNVITPSEVLESMFLALNITYGKAHKDMSKLAQGKSVVHLHNADLKTIVLQYPSILEQRKICEFFKSLDNLITLHQRKFETLKKLKKGFLQKMFPKNGESVPEIRFPGFTDAWEQRKLGEITGKVIGGGTPKTCVSEYWDGDIPWIQSSNVQENEMFDFDIPKSITQEGLEKSAAKLVPENSIAVVTHVGVGKLVFVPFSYTTSQDFTSLSELKTDAQFTCYSLYQRIKNDLHIVQGSAIKGITKDDLLSKEIMVPEIQEQRKIGNYFRKLDNLITLHQRKLDILKKLKQGMLQQMFI